MKRSIAILSVLLTLALLAAPVPSDAQQPGKVFRIGYLGVSMAGYDLDARNCPIKGSPLWQAFMAGLREHGYLPGQNLVIECRWTESREERARAVAAELVSLKADLLVAFSSTNVRAAKQATTTLPIVMVGVIHPVERGLVASLARPGGNVTGPSEDAGPQITGKRLELLKEAVPTASRVAVLGYLVETPEPIDRADREATARALNVALQNYGFRDPEKLEGIFAEMTKAGVQALLVQPHPMIAVHGSRIVDLAAKSGLPAMYPFKDLVEVGGLMAYDVDRSAIFRRLGGYVDKILKGANPGDFPVEQPTKFDLVINLKTAKALGLTIPPALLMRADHVIE